MTNRFSTVPDAVRVDRREQLQHELPKLSIDTGDACCDVVHYYRKKKLVPRGMASLRLFAVLLLAALVPSRAIKLKFTTEECLSYSFNQYEYFYGSFVAMPDAYGMTAKYDLVITAPSEQKLYEVHRESEATFHLVPVEAGAHKFCLKFNPEASPTRHMIARDVLWSINVGYQEGHDKVEETDTQYLWHHVYQIDGPGAGAEVHVYTICTGGSAGIGRRWKAHIDGPCSMPSCVAQC